MIITDMFKRKSASTVRQAITPPNKAGREYVNATDMASLVAAFKNDIYVCVNRNSNAFAAVNFRLYSVKKDVTSVANKKLDTREFNYLKKDYSRYLRGAIQATEIFEHPIIDVLNKPNDMQGGTSFMYLVNAFLDTTGNTIIAKVRNRNRMIVQLWVLPVQNVVPVIGKNKVIQQWVYKSGNNKIYFDPKDIIHHKHQSMKDTIWGMSPIEGVSNSFNLRESTDEYENTILSNDGRLAGIITTKNAIIGTPGYAAFREEIDAWFTGSSNRGKVGVLDQDTTYVPISVSPQDMNSSEGKSFSSSEIRAAYGQSDALYNAGTNRAALDAADYQFAKTAIKPRIKMFEDLLNNNFIKEYDESLFIVYDNPVPRDEEFLHKKRKEEVLSGIIAPNEAREEIGREPKDGLDSTFVPVNLVRQEDLEEYNNENKD